MIRHSVSGRGASWPPGSAVGPHDGSHPAAARCVADVFVWPAGRPAGRPGRGHGRSGSRAERQAFSVRDPDLPRPRAARSAATRTRAPRTRGCPAPTRASVASVSSVAALVWLPQHPKLHSVRRHVAKRMSRRFVSIVRRRGVPALGVERSAGQFRDPIARGHQGRRPPNRKSAIVCGRHSGMGHH